MKYINVNFDLYIFKSDMNLLEIGEIVNGYKQVKYPELYEIISQYAFQPAEQIDENTFRVSAIMK